MEKMDVAIVRDGLIPIIADLSLRIYRQQWQVTF